MDPHPEHGQGWREWSVFAAVMLLLLGPFHAVVAIAAILGDELYAAPEYALALDVTTWGWIHLVAGIVVFVAGLGVLAGAVWARAVAVLVALLSMVANFAWLPYRPVWSVAMLVVAGCTVYALVAHGRDVAE